MNSRKKRGFVGKEEIFPERSRVEVTRNGERYVATVLSTPSSKSQPHQKRSRTVNLQNTNCYFVEYENLFTDENPSKPLSEWVDVSCMRQEQPNAEGAAVVDGDDGQIGFQVNDVVDGGPNFLIHFQNSPDEMECKGSDLQIHDQVGRELVGSDKQRGLEMKKEAKKASMGGSIYEKTSQNRDERLQILFLEEPLNNTTSVNNGSPIQVSNGKAIHEKSESNDGQNYTAMSAVVISVEESKNLPFEKSSPVWKNFELMKEFQTSPQRPHFSPLHESSEYSREGTAIGLMFTYAKLVKMTLTLQVSDPQSMFESSLTSLKELEYHGFQVESIRARLTELKRLKVKMGEVEDSSKLIEGEILDLNEEKKRLEEEMDKVKEERRLIEERGKTIASAMESLGKHIDTLRSKVKYYAGILKNDKV